MKVDSKLLAACKNAVVIAAKTDEPIEPLVERLFVEYEGVMTRESMRIGAAYIREYEIARVERAAAAAKARAERFKAAQADDVACLEMLMELSGRLPGIIERLKAEPTSG